MFALRPCVFYPNSWKEGLFPLPEMSVSFVSFRPPTLTDPQCRPRPGRPPIRWTRRSQPWPRRNHVAVKKGFSNSGPSSTYFLKPLIASWASERKKQYLPSAEPHPPPHPLPRLRLPPPLCHQGRAAQDLLLRPPQDGRVALLLLGVLHSAGARVIFRCTRRRI